VRTWSTTCDPEAPSQPPPRAGSNHHSGTRAAGSATSGTYCTIVTRRGGPTTPAAMARATVARSGAQRNSWPTRWVTPARCAASCIARADAPSTANGFSHTTCRPAAAAAMVSSACVAGGVAIVTASVPEIASASVSDVHGCSIPRRAARRAVFSGSRPTSARTSNPAARNAGTCTRQPNPVPTTTAPGGWDGRDGRRGRGPTQ
jgi:hypothetical protein